MTIIISCDFRLCSITIIYKSLFFPRNKTSIKVSQSQNYYFMIENSVWIPGPFRSSLAFCFKGPVHKFYTAPLIYFLRILIKVQNRYPLQINLEPKGHFCPPKYWVRVQLGAQLVQPRWLVGLAEVPNLSSWGAWSVKQGARSVQPGARSQQQGAWLVQWCARLG